MDSKTTNSCVHHVLANQRLPRWMRAPSGGHESQKDSKQKNKYAVMNSKSTWETTSSEYGLLDGEYAHWIATMCVTDPEITAINLKPIDACAESLHNCHKDATCDTNDDLSKGFKCTCVNKMEELGLIVVGNGVGENGCKYSIQPKPQNIYGNNYKPVTGPTSGSISGSMSGSTSGSTSGSPSSSGDVFGTPIEDFTISFTFDSPYETESGSDLFIYHQADTKMTFSEAFHYCARQGLRRDFDIMLKISTNQRA